MPNAYHAADNTHDYADRRAEWLNAKAVELVDDFNRDLARDDEFHVGGEEFTTAKVMAEAIDAQICFDKRLYEIAELEALCLFDKVSWD
jgi:hypothetical protein